MQGAYMTYSEPAESYQPAPPFYSIPIQAPAGFYYAPAPAAAPLPAADEVRTVFITGFPDDVKERELNNMLRFLPGYEASQMHFRNGQAQGFALFSTGSAARQAVDAVQNLVFDNDCVLRAEMAHKNMYLKDDPSLAPKRSRPSYEGGSYGGYPAAPPPGVAPPPGAYAYGPPAGSAPVGVVPPVQPRGYAPITNTKDNPPCNTLFIGNLGDGVNEAEIRGLFRCGRRKAGPEPCSLPWGKVQSCSCRPGLQPTCPPPGTCCPALISILPSFSPARRAATSRASSS
jgi:hypothetical protein